MPKKKSTKKSSGFKSSKFSPKQLALFAFAIAVVGGVALWTSYATGRVDLGSVEAEKMTLPDGARIVKNPNASKQLAARFTKPGAASANFTLPKPADSFRMVARYGNPCTGLALNATIDGQAVASNVSLSSTSFKAYDVKLATPIASGSHALQVSVSEPKASCQSCALHVFNCGNFITLDRVIFSTSKTTTPMDATLSGTVTYGPTAPNCQYPRQCPSVYCGNTQCNQPLANHQIQALDASGNIKAQATTDKDGKYSMKLAIGHYSLKLVPTVGLGGGTTYPVDVKAGANTFNIAADTGIR